MFTIELTRADLLAKCVVYRLSLGDLSVKRLRLADCDWKEEDESVTLKATSVELNKELKEVVSKEYEGGFTIWESSWVFLAFLAQLKSSMGGLAIELGCGHGLCGLFMSLKGYNVLYQDLNKEVMYEALVPNYILNHGMLQGDSVKLVFEGETSDPFNYLARVTAGGNDQMEVDHEAQLAVLSCSWSDMVSKNIPDVLENCQYLSERRNKCRLILACECTYRIENYQDLTMIIAEYLDKDQGVAYVATKRFYFGLSGGTFQFVEFVKESGLLTAKIVYSNKLKNSSNFVDVIEIKRV